ncbi:MAG: FHA domain-containing protein [Alphaproteobacteria bacterium]|nr:FHA domain-containing protein [Alphaproteobacteria bacterium]
MSTPHLSCVDGPRKGQSFEITAQGLRLGRDPSNDIPLDDPAVSRFHGRVILHNAAIWVQDAGSRNGIFVNGVRVTANKQIKPGDKLAIGEHVFLIELVEEDVEHSVSVNLDSLNDPSLISSPGAPPEEKRWKIWPFLLAVVLIGGCIGLISLSSSGDEDGRGEVDEAGEPSLLASALETPKEKPEGEGDAPEGKPPRSLDLEGVLEVASGGEGGQWPDPPEGATVAELVDQGFEAQRAGRLREALEAYHMAMKLDEECGVCPGRIERLTEELDAAVQENFDAGLRYFKSLQYQQAIDAWEQVLLLEPNEGADVHRRTQDYLQQARAQLDAGG